MIVRGSMRSLSIALFLALIALLSVWSLALAEGETPTAPETPDTGGETVLETQPEEQPAPEEPAPTPEGEAQEADPLQEPAAPAEVQPEPAGVDEPASEEPTALQEVVETVAENGLTLTNPEGESVPLVSQEAEELLVDVDPFFTVGSTTYNFTAADCNPDVAGNQACGNPLQAAINYLESHDTLIPNDRMIHIEGATLSIPGNVTITGSNLAANQLQGLVGAGSSSSGVAVPTVLNFASGFYMNILGIPNAFTLQGMDITGIYGGTGLVNINGVNGNLTLTDVSIENNVNNSSSYGLYVTGVGGSITANKLVVSDNDSKGAYFENNAGSSGVTIRNSEFNRNGAGATVNNGNGLEISTKGPVLLEYVSSSSNNGFGASISGQSSLVVKNAVFSNNIATDADGIVTTPPYTLTSIVMENVTADGNADRGLNLYANGAITLTNIHASGSAGSYGIYLNNCNQSGGSCQTTRAGNITVTNLVASENYNSNLVMVARNNITLTNIETMYSSNGYGLIAYNWYTPGGTITATNIRSMTNDGKGVSFYATSHITVNNVIATDNHDAGGWFESKTGTVTIKGTSSTWSDFSHSGGTGLFIDTPGSVILNYVRVNQVTGDGVGIQINQRDTDHVSGSTSLTQVEASNNAGNGISHQSDGPVTLNTITAIHNGYNNVSIQNAWTDLLKAYNVSITNGTFNEAQSVAGTAGYGLHILSVGNVTLNNVTALTNQNHGVKIGDMGNPDPAVTGDDIRAKTVTVTNSGGRYNYFSANLDDGLYVFATHINLSYVNASSNGLSGMVVVGSGNFTGKNLSTNSNGLEGLYVEILGSASITSIVADNNGSDGVRIDNRVPEGSQVKPITLTTVNASSNDSRGMWLSSNGQITLTNVTANSNDEGNALFGIQNETWSTGGVTIKTSGSYRNSFSASSTGFGISIPYSYAAVSISNADINYNQDGGLDITLINKVGAGLTLNNLALIGNHHGVYAITKGPIVFNNSTVSDHTSNVVDGEYGANLSNTGDVTKQYNITFSNTTFDNNETYNLNITSTGSVVLTNVSATNSSEGYGVTISTMPGSGLGSVTIKATGSNWAYFSGNGNSGDTNDHGITITTRGGVTMSRVSARDNEGTGLLVNCVPGGDIHKPLSITTGVFNANNLGMNLLIKGAVTLVDVRAQGNTTRGAYVNNAASEINQTLTVKNSRFDDNGNYGLDAIVQGVIAFTNIGATGNANHGLYLNNQPDDEYYSKVTITNSNHTTYNMDGNTSSGIYIQSYGEVVLTNVSASNSNGAGGVLLTIINLSGVDGHRSIKLINSKFDNGAAGSVGAMLTSSGSIFLDRVSVSGNGGGLNANNTGAPVVDLYGVTIQRSQFNNNTAGYGLQITSKGAVVFNNVVANGNMAGAGANITNDAGSNASPVTLSSSMGRNSFNGNHTTYGLFILSRGTVSISGTDVLNNPDSTGAYVRNTGNVTLNPNVTVSNSIFSGNGNGSGESGLDVGTRGVITLDLVTANGNFAYGALLTNNTGTKDVVVQRYTGTDNNNNNLFVNSAGIVTLNGITVLRSINGYGARVEATKDVKVLNSKGANTASGNHFSGLGLLSTTGSVSVTGVTANDNTDGSGIGVQATLGNITINTVVTSHNGHGSNGNGLSLNALAGNVTVSNFKSFSNQDNGLDGLLSMGVLTLTNGTVTGNRLYGISANTKNTDGSVITNVNYFANNTSGMASNFYIY